nr:hypothetical protein [Candidatus Paracaedibacter acanthamoebae]
MNCSNKDAFKASIFLPTLESAENAGMMNFWLPKMYFFNRQLFPLASRMHDFQDIVEDPIKWNFCMGVLWLLSLNEARQIH